MIAKGETPKTKKRKRGRPKKRGRPPIGSTRYYNLAAKRKEEKQQQKQALLQECKKRYSQLETLLKDKDDTVFMENIDKILSICEFLDAANYWILLAEECNISSAALETDFVDMYNKFKRIKENGSSV